MPPVLLMGKLLFAILLLVHSNTHAQTLSLNTKQKFFNGDSKVIPDQFQYSAAINLTSNFQVTAVSDLMNGTNRIPIGHVKLQLAELKSNGVALQLTGNAPEIALSTTKTEFASGLTVQALVTNVLSIKYSCIGADAFLNKPPGEYKTTLDFTYNALLNPNAVLGSYELVVKIENVGTIQTSNISLEFSTQSSFTNGLDLLQSNFISNIFSNQPFKLFIKTLTPDFSFAGNTIPANNLQLKHETSAVIPLSPIETLLLPQTGTISPVLSDRNYSLKTLTTALNTYFLNKPPGIYVLNYQVYITDASNVAIPGATAMATGTISIKILNAVGLQFNPTALQANMKFSLMEDYKQGVTLQQDLALQIFSNNPYILTVRASTPNLTYNTHQIPVENILLKASQEIITQSIATPEISLSTTSTTLINASSQGMGTFSKKYHLKYFTTPGNTIFLNRQSGIYTTTLTYTLTAP